MAKYKVGDIARWKSPYENELYKITGYTEDGKYTLVLVDSRELTAIGWTGVDSIDHVDEFTKKLTKLDKVLK